MTVERTAKIKVENDQQATAGSVAGFAAVAAAVAGAVAAVHELASQLAAANDQIAKSARAAGLGAAEYQRLAHAAELSGGSIKSIEKGLLNLNAGLEDMALGKLGPVKEGLDEIGISADQLAGRSATGKLKILADGLANVSDRQRQAAIAADLFGKKTGRDLVLALREGGGALQDLIDDADAYGIRSQQQLENSEALVDAQTRVNAAFDTFLNDAIGPATPAITRASEATANLAANSDAVTSRLAEEIELFAELTASTFEWIDSLNEAESEMVQFSDVTTAALLAASGQWRQAIDSVFEYTSAVEAANDGTQAVATAAALARQTAAQIGAEGSITDPNAVTAQAFANLGPTEASIREAARNNRRGRGRPQPDVEAHDAGGFDTAAADAVAEAVRERAIAQMEEQILATERSIEIAEEQGANATILHNTRVAQIEELAQLTGDRSQVEEEEHQRKLEQIRAERSASQAALEAERAQARERIQLAVSIGSATMQIAQETASVIQLAGQAAGASEEEQARRRIRSQGLMALGIGALEVVKAVAAFASFNYVEGALHTAASALAFARGGIMLSGQVPGDTGAEGGAAALGGAPPAPAATTQTQAPTIPTSPVEDQERSQPNEQQTRSGGTTVTVQGNVFTSGAGDFVRELRQMQMRGERAAG